MDDIEKLIQTKPDILNISFKKVPTVPDSLWQSVQLTKLVLAGNPITHIPPELGNLTNLKQLHLGSTDITTCPEEISALTSLTYLNFAESKLVKAPEGVGALSSLSEVLFTATPISSIPDTYTQLASCLRVLKVGKCQFTAIPEPIGQLVNLKELYLNNNLITGTIPSFLYNLTALETLDLSGNQILSLMDDSIFDLAATERDELFGGLSKLRSLMLNDNQLEQILPNTVSNFTALEVLSLQYNRISSLAEDICKLTNLKVLDVSVNKISAVPEEWATIPDLHSLDISYNDISTIPPVYANFPSLKIFSVMGNNFDGIPPPCQKLQIQGCRIRYNQEDILPNEIVPGLFLGGVVAARDKYTLRRLGITHILTVAEIDPIHPEDFVYKVIRIDDHADQDLGAFFVECYEFIDEARKKGGVLVHCAAGISRSATVVTSYVMAIEHMNMESALAFVRTKRSIVCPNSGFREQLVKYEDVVLKEDRESKCIIS